MVGCCEKQSSVFLICNESKYGKSITNDYHARRVTSNQFISCIKVYFTNSMLYVQSVTTMSHTPVSKNVS